MANHYYNSTIPYKFRRYGYPLEYLCRATIFSTKLIYTMTQLQTKSFLVLLLLTVAGMVQAQTPFWTEDFHAGIPAGWTNVDASGQGAIWTWCNDPAAGNNQPGCPSIFDDGNAQVPFQATTATNGFATMDSDEYGGLTNDHISELTTSAIDCSGKSEVYITFQTHIGVYTVDAADGAILRVSTDKVSWKSYTIFPGLTTSKRWSANPEKPTINISDKAAGKATVYIQWQWTGNFEYLWSLDDIGVYSENPAPHHDMALGDFYYPPSSFAQPVSQISTDTFGFGSYLTNKGARNQTNVVLKATVTTNGGGDLLFADSLVIPEVAVGVTDSFFELPHTYAPELPLGTYRVDYTVRADSVDLRPQDNSDGDPFLVTNSIFSKENGNISNNFRPGGGGDWYVANLYRMGAGTLDNYKATTAQFAFGADASELAVADVAATLYMFRVKDGVNADFTNFPRAKFLSDSLVWVGTGLYEADDTTKNNQLQNAELFDFNTGESGVPLEHGKRYYIALGYTGASRVVYHAFAEDIYMFNVSTSTYSDQWYPGGFLGNPNAVLRLIISLVTTTDNQSLPQSTMTLFPNPVQESLNLGLDFAKPTDATITIADVTGRVIRVEDRQSLTNETLTYQLPQLASGTYLARIATKEGTLTKKFVVQK